MQSYLRYFVSVILIFVASLSCSPLTTKTVQPARVPSVSFTLTPKAMDKLEFQIQGRISPCIKQNESAKILLPENSQINFFKNNVELLPDSKREITVACETSSLDLPFEGTVTMKQGKCDAFKDEIYCLAKSYPNPEVYADRIQYHISFNLKPDLTALAPDPSLTLPNGIMFQIGKLKQVDRKKTAHFMIDFIFPEDFTPDTSQFLFIEETLESYFEYFGPLDFNQIRIGAIRRGEKTNEITGTPSGNLILFSRSALGAPFTDKELKLMGISSNLAFALRKLIIAHELSHFWFSDRFIGTDGWMTEGIPHYLGMLAVKKALPNAFGELLKMFHYLDKKGLQTPIPNRPFGGGDDYIKAYYQGPLALYKIGESIGHEEVIQFIADVYRQNANPNFKLFESIFLKRFPDKEKVWRAAWRI